MAKRWKKQEVTYLKRYAKRKQLSELAERFKTQPQEVATKLTELGLASQDGYGHVPRPRDPLVDIYERGVKALHGNRWQDAKEYFTQVQEQTQDTELAGRARRYLQIVQAKKGRGPKHVDEDPFLLAVYERNRGNLEEALAICNRGGRQSKDERFAYLAASLHALMGDQEKAAKLLTLAIELNPKNRIHAFHETDFEVLRSDPELRQIFF